jgi:hypothetical protein
MIETGSIFSAPTMIRAHPRGGDVALVAALVGITK